MSSELEVFGSAFGDATYLDVVDGDELPIHRSVRVVTVGTANPATTVSLPSATRFSDTELGGPVAYVFNLGPEPVTIRAFSGTGGDFSTVVAAGAGAEILLLDNSTVQGDWVVSTAGPTTTINQGLLTAIGYLIAGLYNPTTVFEYNYLADLWATKTSIPVNSLYGAFAKSSRIFTYSAGQNFTAQFATYELTANVWVLRAPILGRSEYSASAAGLVFGGPSTVLAGTPPIPGVVRRYDPGADTWTNRATLPGDRRIYAAAAETSAGVVQFAGGIQFDSAVAYVPNPGLWHEYDETGDLFTAKSPANAPFDRVFSPMVAVAGKAYVFGGHIPNSVVLNNTYELDPGTGIMTAKAFMPVPLTGRGAFPVGTDIYVYCGQATKIATAITNLVHRYNTVADTWVVQATAPVLKFGNTDFGLSV